MISQRFQPAAILVKTTAAINFTANLLGIALSFIFICVLEPRLKLNPGDQLDLYDRAVFFIGVVAFSMVPVAPFSLRLILPLYRKVKHSVNALSPGEYSPAQLEELRGIAGRLLSLPVKLAGTTCAGWCIAALTVLAVPHIAPQLFPWPQETAHRTSAWLVLVGAPTTMAWLYFSEDKWLKQKISELLPAEALLDVPSTFRISAVSRLLMVLLPIGIIPAAVISHITVYNIHEIQAGRQSMAILLDTLPITIFFLLLTSVVLAVGLSVVVAKSFSFSLRRLESAMETVGSGNLDVRIPVVSNDEIGEVAQGFNRMVRDQQELESIKDTFGRYVSREIVTEILKSHNGTELGGEMRDVTILVADLRSFTAIAETLPPRKVLQLINRFLQTMTDIIFGHNGTIDEFTGDGILVFFGAPRFLPDHSFRAVACAIEMQRAMEKLNEENSLMDFPELKMGIGINRGELIVGNIGSEERKKYGAVGSAINIAFRIEAETKGGQILISPSVQENLQSVLISETYREARLKGLDRSITLYQVNDLLEEQRQLAGSN